MTTATASAPALLDIRAAASLVGISGRHLEDLANEGKAPVPIRLGRCRRYARQRRTFIYRGQWVLDWLDRDSQTSTREKEARCR
jgi:predicted DNA-binding transcriptional regulator AlpA